MIIAEKAALQFVFYVRNALLIVDKDKIAIKSRIQKSIREEHYNVYNVCTFYFMLIAVFSGMLYI